MDMSGRRILLFYQQTSSLIGSQINHRRNLILSYQSNARYESDNEYICIVINGKTRSVPLNILNSVVIGMCKIYLTPVKRNFYSITLLEF